MSTPRTLKYPKIHTSLPEPRAGGKSLCTVKKDALWCATEKVHGANFSFHVHRSGRISCGKRTGLIEEGDPFFGYFTVVERLRQRVYAMAEDLMSAYDCKQQPSSEDPSVVLFGELFGGEYPAITPHSDRVSRAVQQGVFYSPRLEFMLFDICVAMPPSQRSATTSTGECYELEAELHFLSFNEVLTYSHKHGIFCAEPLLVGPLATVSNFNINFPTTIPAALGLPPMNTKDDFLAGKQKSNKTINNNNAEGVVLRPMDFGPTPFGEGGSRPITKLKTTNFRDGEGCPPSVVGSEHIRRWLLSLVEIESECTSQLLASASSKVGSLGDRNAWEGIVTCALEDLADQACDCGNTFDEVKDELRFKLFNVLAMSCT